MKRKVVARKVREPVQSHSKEYPKETGGPRMSRLSHKLALICVKYIPPIAALVDLISIILVFMDMGSFMLDYVFGTSVISLVPMYIMSYAFKFCKYHRMILNYILANRIVFLVDSLFKLSVEDISLFLIYLGIAGIFLILIIHDYLKYGDINNS